MPSHLPVGVADEAAWLADIGAPKNTGLWRPSAADIDSAAFDVVVGPAKYTKELGWSYTQLFTQGKMESLLSQAFLEMGAAIPGYVFIKTVRIVFSILSNCEKGVRVIY